MADERDQYGYLPPGLAVTQPIWSQPNDHPNVPNVNSEWLYGTPVGKWNMTSFNYDQWSNIPGQSSEARFCALNSEDFDIPPGRVSYSGQLGDLFPNCYTRRSDILKNQKFFSLAQQAQSDYAAGKYDAVSEINRLDPYALEPCKSSKSIFEALAPFVGAIAAAVGTGIVLNYAMPDGAPQALKTISVVGALAFGFGVGSAIAERNASARREIFQTSSAVLGAAAGADLALVATYIALPDWQDHEYIWIAIGGTAGYFLLTPLILPYIDNYLTGVVGFVFRLIDDITSMFGGIACQIGNWDQDGCTALINPQARTWDRIYLATALVDEMAKKNDMDEKEREVAFQALLLNAASYSTWKDNYEIASEVAGYDSERGWNGTERRPTDANRNNYSPFGPIVQAWTANSPAWYDKLSGASGYEYYWTMFAKDTNMPLLQRCAPIRTLIGDSKIQQWMDDAYKLAKKGKMQPYPVSQPMEAFSCEKAYLWCMQERNEEAAYHLATVLRSNYGDQFIACRKDPSKFKFIVWWEVFLQWAKPATGAERVIAEDYLLTKGQEKVDLLQHQETAAGIVAIFRHFKLDSTIGDNVQAQEIWRFWLYCAQKDRNTPIPLLPTKCQETISHIERNNATYKELADRTWAMGGVDRPVRGCTERQDATIYAWRGMHDTPCDIAVQNGVGSFNRNPSAVAECGWGEAFMAASDFRKVCSAESQFQVEQWVAACSQ